MEEFITAYLLVLAQQGDVKDLSISDRILADIITSNEDFNHVRLCYNKQEWLYPLENSYRVTIIKEKIVQIKDYL